MNSNYSSPLFVIFVKSPTCKYVISSKITQFLLLVTAVLTLFDCRKEYEQHSEEDDAERVQQIIDRAVRDAEWILKKYNKQ